MSVSPKKTLQGIYAQQVWAEDKPTRRIMHEAVFEAGWKAEELLPRHRKLIAPEHRNRGREVISLDWTLVHHERGPHIYVYGNTKSYDYVERRMGRLQTTVTAVSANRQLIDRIEAQIQVPNVCKEEEEYLKATVQASYDQMEQARTRLLELLHHVEHKLAYKKRTEIVVEIVKQLEEEGHFPQADYAFDNGVLTVELTQLIESKGKHWVSEIESSRLILCTRSRSGSRRNFECAKRELGRDSNRHSSRNRGTAAGAASDGDPQSQGVDGYETITRIFQTS